MAKNTERKMHCVPQPKGNDSPKVSEVGKNSESTTYQQQDKVTSLEVTKHSQGSSASKINSDSRCAILTFLSVETDGTWRILAVPVQCLNHINLASGIKMDGLQLLFPPPAPLNRSKKDQCKGSRGQVPLSAYTAKSYERSFTGSNTVRRRCQNKVANKACKLKELPADSCAQSSVVSSSPSLSPHSSATVISSDKWMSNTNEDKSLKKASRKRAKKKQIKNQSIESGSNDREVRTEEYGCVSLTSETCSSNDVDTIAPEFSSSDDRFMKIDCERNEMNDKVNVMDAPKRGDPCIEEAVMSKAESRSQLLDRETKDIQDDELCCFNDTQDTLVLDSVSIGSKSDESVHGGHIGKQSNKASRGDEYLFGQGLTNGFCNTSEHNEETRNSGQNCIVNDKRVQQKRAMSKSSSFNKFTGGGVLHGRTGKENSHSVWQKVQKNSSSECGGGGDLKKVTTPSSQFISTTDKDGSAIKNCNTVGTNVVSGGEVKKQAKNKTGRKSKGKTADMVLKKGPCNYSRKGSNYNRTVLNDNMKGSIQQNDSSNMSSQEINQQGTIMELQTNGVKQESSEIVHNEKFHPVESDIQKISQEAKNASIDIQSQVSCSDEQSQASCNLLDDQVGQSLKEVSSADYNAQNHSSGSSQWKWIPVGKKDTGMTKSESEYSDEPTSKNFELENTLKPKTDSFSQKQDSSPNAVTCIGQIEGENHKLDEEISGTQAEHRGKHEVANHMIYECENQDIFEIESYRIGQAVNDTFRVQLACEVVHKATGGPVAEFERLLHFCSPVICRSLDSLSCLTCSQNDSVGASLCRHEIPEVSLGSLWEWYEKHGSYGLEIRAWDYANPKTFGGVGHFPFRAYFVPSLSAIQLFKNRENRRVNSNARFLNCKVSEDSFTDPINDGSNPYTDSTSSGDLELLFEYFECEQPQQRRPLYERIQELVRGNVPIQSKTYGDTTKLDSINLQDLHPRSWYSVAWYPIYRIPDGNFRASFLTYHSLGHLVRRSSNSDSPTLGSSVVSPVVGLQSYNAQGECWFRLNHSALAAEMIGINPSIFLRERLRTLEETASLMARAVVNKGNQVCTNRHPDYEFFLSRRRY